MELRTTQGAGVDRVTILVYGGPGVGKTTLCGTTGEDEATLIISAEAGLLPLRHKAIAVAHVETYDDIRAALVVARQDRWRWVCVDSLSEIAEVTLASELKRNADPRRAYGEVSARISELVRFLRNLPKHVVLVTKQDRQAADGAMLYGPMLPGKQLAKSLPYLVDEVLALRTRSGEDGEIVRWLQTVNDGVYEAKDRSDALDPAEPPDLGALVAKILSTMEV